QGRVKLSMSSSEGKTVTLRTAQPGEVLGLHAVVSGKPYEATAETLGPCQVNFVRREDFLQFLREHPEASIHAARELSSSYQSACADAPRCAWRCCCSLVLLVRIITDQRDGSEEQGGNGSRVLQCSTRHLGRVNDTDLNEGAKDLGLRVEAVVRVALRLHFL